MCKVERGKSVRPPKAKGYEPPLWGARRAENRVNLGLTAEPDRVKDRCAIALKRTRHINDS